MATVQSDRGRVCYSRISASPILLRAPMRVPCPSGISCSGQGIAETDSGIVSLAVMACPVSGVHYYR